MQQDANSAHEDEGETEDEDEEGQEAEAEDEDENGNENENAAGGGVGEMEGGCMSGWALHSSSRFDRTIELNSTPAVGCPAVPRKIDPGSLLHRREEDVRLCIVQYSII